MKKWLLAAVFLLPSLAFAWGGEGHQIVALVAETRLTSEAAAGVRDLLGEGVDISDAEIANWADVVRRDRSDTAPWHYVNIPIAAAGYDAERDGPVNILTAIDAQSEILADAAAPREARAEALKFLVHLVGDLHQPLHAGDRNGDRGGNACLVFMPESRAQKASSLHSVWDGAMLRQWLRGSRVAEYADRLVRRSTPAELDAMAAGTSVDWANESHDVSRDAVYPGVPEGVVTRLTPAYVAAARPVTDRQLVRGGVRLAATLNRALAKTRPASPR